MKDRLEDVLLGRQVAPPQDAPWVEIISLRTLGRNDNVSVRRFLAQIQADLDCEFVVVGGRSGCTRLALTVVAPSVEEARRLLVELFSSEQFRKAALNAEFTILISRDPYIRQDLKTGRVDGDIPQQGLLLFFSYAHEDQEFRDELGQHLKLLERQGLIEAWHDRMISAGSDWNSQIDARLQRAQIVLLLISASFVASDYCYDLEMEVAMRRHEERLARVIPILIRPVDLMESDIRNLQMLPRGGRPISLWANRDDAWTDVAKGIRDVVREIRQ
jgi:hypothetical protein